MKLREDEAWTDSLAEKDAITLASTPMPLMPNAQAQGGPNVLAASGIKPQKTAVPISVFVSRKLGRLFVRQRFTPLFDAPIKIENPDEPLGTHVFTLLNMQDGGASLRWNVVSMPETFSGASKGPNNLNAQLQEISGNIRPDPSSDDASAALDRIEIPPDVVGRISQLLTPGSSFIVSDYGLSRETGNDTDFIIVMH